MFTWVDDPSLTKRLKKKKKKYLHVSSFGSVRIIPFAAHCMSERRVDPKRSLTNRIMPL